MATKKTTTMKKTARTGAFPRIDLTNLDAAAMLDKAGELARDAVYITVGFGVLTVQKAQVRRRELMKALEERQCSEPLTDVRRSAETGLKELDERLQTLEEKLDDLVVEVQQRLPEQAGSVVGQVYETAKSAGSQVRELVKRAA